MSTILPKEPVVTDRESVILSNAERRYLRRKVKDSIDTTKAILNPRHQLKRLVERQVDQTKDAARATVKIAKNNAPMIGVLGISALIFTARGPISRWILNLRKSTPEKPRGD